ncbi:hypothetical protein PssvBMR6_gp59 [Pseudomonas phage MR6]|nr:hypothetical protein PssvBMR6_gp59 [Pseudomonas phage MR6]
MLLCPSGLAYLFRLLSDHAYLFRHRWIPLVIPHEYTYLLPISLSIGISIRFLFASLSVALSGRVPNPWIRR